jgi:hypothetical protein
MCLRVPVVTRTARPHRDLRRIWLELGLNGVTCQRASSALTGDTCASVPEGDTREDGVLH